MTDYQDDDPIPYPHGQVKMTFPEWVKAENINLLELEHLIGCKAETIRNWASGASIPWRLHRLMLDKISNGKLIYKRNVPRLRGRSEVLQPSP